MSAMFTTAIGSLPYYASNCLKCTYDTSLFEKTDGGTPTSPETVEVTFRGRLRLSVFSDFPSSTEVEPSDRLRDCLGNGEGHASREATDKGRLPCTLKLRDTREVAFHKPE